MDTTTQYKRIIRRCKDIFLKKNADYGSAWRILRQSSLTDQLYIKASRIRSVEEKGVQKIGDEIELEFAGIINYAIMALIQIDQKDNPQIEMDIELLENLYDKFADMAHALMLDKNHDYGEAWRDMRVSSMTDLILMKLLRIKQIEDNNGITLISEGIDANFIDIINYAIFALIRLEETEK